MSSAQFFFHDYETFGQDPAGDRPAQFAGVRTDSEFSIIADPVIAYCAPADDYLPQPAAVMITGITPQEALQKGVNEAQFARLIHDTFTQPDTCILGYNSIRFDDEVTRNIFYRNFYDPYAYSWMNRNSRWDLIDITRACYALRPDGTNWPENDEGLPSFKLEHLTAANGIAHENAHDAMADVYATIAMAKQLRGAQPRLFDYFFSLRDKRKLAALIDIPAMKPLVHVSGMFGAVRANTSLVAPLAWHPDNRNAVIMCDLAGDLTPLLTLDADTLREHLYTRRDDLPEGASPVPLKLVHINKCPILAPENTLRPQDAQRIGLDKDRCARNAELLHQHPEIREKVVAVFAQPREFPVQNDVDRMIYQGFFSESDKAAMTIIRETDPKNLPALALSYQDARLPELLFRYRARNFPGTLDEHEQQRWLAHRREVFSQDNLTRYFGQIGEMMQEYQHDANKTELLKKLVQYAQHLAE